MVCNFSFKSLTNFFFFLNQAKTRLFFLLFLRVWRLGYDAVTIACGVASDGGRLDSEKLSMAWCLTAHLEARVW
jgi:hypothetical protein